MGYRRCPGNCSQRRPADVKNGKIQIPGFSKRFYGGIDILYKKFKSYENTGKTGPVAGGQV